MAELQNNKIQVLKTVGKGYRTFKKFRGKILPFRCGMNFNLN